MTATPFAATAPLAFDKALGLCFGWLCFSKQGGAPYVDAHGDHFPDDELVLAADELMAKPAAERAINVDHAGGARGTISTVQALTEDVAKALRIDTGGTYGLVGSFRPDAALLKSIVAGEAFCLSIEGSAADVEVIAKSADAALAEAGCKRVMRKVSLTKLAVVKAGAHEGAAVALVKSAKAALAVRRIAKREPALTSATDGHQHLIDDTDCDSGFTSYECNPGGYGHSHPWVKGEADTITIGAANGHSHTVTPELDTEDTAMPDPAATVTKAEDLAAAKAACDKLMADVAELHAALGMAASLTADEQAVAKGLAGPALLAFLKLPAEVRKAKSTPIYKSADGTAYFASDDQRLVAMAKSADAQAVELAKAREQAEAVGFEKAAGVTIPNLKGTPQVKAAIMKSIAALPEADRTAVTETLRGADAAMALLFKTQGHNIATDPASPQAELDAIAADIAKTKGVSIAKAADLALDTPRGAQLYKQIEGAKRATATA